MAGGGADDHRYDVVVLGTGAAGLTAAVRAAADGAQVGLFERAKQVGGTSAWSGGVVDWLEAHTPVEFETLAGMSDYHPEHPGGRREGRSVECPLFPFEELAEWAGRVTVGWQLTGEFCMSENTGDALRMAMRVGADLADMREAWWVATIDPIARHDFMAIVLTAAVDDGARFTNEAANYNALGNAFHVVDVARFAYVNHPAWLLIDHHFLSRYGPARHKPPPPAGALQDTVQGWNAHAAAGADPDFHRGESHHDRAWGDPAFGYTPQATIGPLDTPPYYATRVRCGTLGTKGGPRTDVSGRVLDVDGKVIDGLYAAGNAMGSIMGMTYGGHGGTLGPGLVFGYLTGRHAAARAASGRFR